MYLESIFLEYLGMPRPRAFALNATSVHMLVVWGTASGAALRFCTAVFLQA